MLVAVTDSTRCLLSFCQGLTMPDEAHSASLTTEAFVPAPNAPNCCNLVPVHTTIAVVSLTAEKNFLPSQ